MYYYFQAIRLLAAADVVLKLKEYAEHFCTTVTGNYAWYPATKHLTCPFPASLVMATPIRTC